MKLNASNELLIRRYLLCSVSEDEREQVETRLMTDDNFFRQINLVEDELVEEYLDGGLQDKERLRFEDTFLCAPERQHKLRFSRAMRVYAANAARQSAVQDAHPGNPWVKRIVSLFNVSRPILAYSLMAALLGLSGGGVWSVVRMRDLREQNRELLVRQELAGAEASALRTRLEEAGALNKNLAGQLQQEQEIRVPTQFAALRPPSFTLFSGIQRSAGSSRQLQIPKTAILVDLKLDLAGNGSKTYRAVLASGGQEILSRIGLKALVSEKEIAVRFSVPATDLPNGYCEIRLYGSDENEIPEIYSFRVVRN